MVGYEKNDSLTSTQKMCIGCASGMITKLLTQPLDVIKIRSQIQKKKKQRTIITITKKIAAKEGYRAFFYGHTLGQVHSVLNVGAQFFAYEMSTSLLASTSLTKNQRSFLGGLFAGCFAATAVNPLEVIRVRQMVANDQYAGFFKGAKNVYQSGGILAFYEGLGASLLQMGPASAISFGVFAFLQPLTLRTLFEKCHEDCSHAKLNKHRPRDLLIATSIAASVAGLLSKTITYPLDLVKRRLQFATHKEIYTQGGKRLIKCNKFLNCFVVAYQKEGFRGLFRGLKVTLYKAQLSSIIIFSSYEMLCYILREIQT